MKRILTIIVLGVTALVLLAAVGLGIFLATFNPNSYKGQISAAAEKATGRQLRFDGDIEMTFFPTLGLKTGRLTLLDPEDFGPEPFLTVKSASLALAVEPLLNDILEVEDVTLNGARLKLVTTSTGRNNWEYGFGKAEDAGQPPASGTGAPPSRDGVTPLEAPRADAPPPPSPPSGQEGKKSFVLHVDEVACADLAVVYRDLRGGASYSGTLDNLAVSGARPDSDIPLEASGSLRDEAGGRDATFSLKALVRVTSQGSVAARIDSLELVAHGLADAPLSLGGSCALAWDQDAASLSVTDLKAALSLAPRQGGSGEPLKTDLQAQALFQTAKDGAPSLSGALNLSTLNLDALLSRMQSPAAPDEQDGVKGAPNLTKPTVRGKKGKGSAQATREEGATEGLPDLNVDLALRAGKLVAGGIPLNAIQVHARMRDKKADIPYSLNIFGGAASGALKADLTGKTPAVALACEVRSLNLESATQTFSGGKYAVTGQMNASLDVTGQGDSAQAILHTLKGKASARSNGGEIRGFKLIPADLPGIGAIPANFPYTLIAASASINQGIATTRDITLQSPVLTGRGGGTVRLAFSQMDLGIDFLLAGLPPAVPVTINGPFSSLSAGVDMRTFLRNVAEAAITTPEGAAGAAKGLIKGVGGLLFKQ